jgi:uncharacterized phage protein (TIGR02218 family)
MTFEAYEETIQLGAPVELYRFNRQMFMWYFTSAATDIVHDARTWLAEPITRTGLESNAGEERGELKITLKRDNAIPAMFLAATPADVIGVTVYRLHVGDTDERAIWVGRVLAVDWKGSEAVLTCEPANTSLLRPGLRRLYSRQCPHRLYGPGCELSRATYNTTVTLSSVSGDAVSSNAFGAMSAGHLAGGILEWTDGSGMVERRMIVTHSGNNITIGSSIPGMPSNALVTVAPGCDHTTGAAGCGKFSNVVNFGGFPYIPSKNPHGGGPLY